MDKHGESVVIRDTLEFVLQRLIELAAEIRCGAGKHERGDDPTNQRNSYRPRTLETRAGSLSLRVPKLRSGTYVPSILEPRKLAEQALVAVVQEARVKGVSTRKVDDFIQAMGMTGISKSQVSRLCMELDERVAAFLSRSGSRLSRGASTRRDDGRCLAYPWAPQRPKRSGRSSCETFGDRACRTSSRSSPAPTRA